MTATTEKLKAALDAVGLTEMGERAGKGYYDDFLSPLATPVLTLANELSAASMHSPQQEAIVALRQRVIDGEFDATREESEAWAASPEGQAAFKALHAPLEPLRTNDPPLPPGDPPASPTRADFAESAKFITVCQACGWGNNDINAPCANCGKPLT